VLSATKPVLQQAIVQNSDEDMADYEIFVDKSIEEATGTHTSDPFHSSSRSVITAGSPISGHVSSEHKADVLKEK